MSDPMETILRLERENAELRALVAATIKSCSKLHVFDFEPCAVCKPLIVGTTLKGDTK